VVAVSVLAIATLLLLYYNTALGFLATFVIAILSPTLVIPIVTEMAAERRMYLPLAAIVVAFIVGGYILVQKLSRTLSIGQRSALKSAASVVTIALILACWLVSAKWVAAYNNPLVVWDQVLRYQPMNHVAHQNMAFHLHTIGKREEAVQHYREAIRISPGSVQGRHNLSTLLLEMGAKDEAVDEIRKTVRLVPNDAAMNNNLAVALLMTKRFEEAIPAFQKSLKLDPNNWTIHKNMAITLREAHRYTEAIKSYERALQLNPKALEIYSNISEVHMLANEPEKAIAALQQGIALAQASGDTRNFAKLSAELAKTTSSM
jgi:tetratricopeptide (TPR) repeat protein